MNYKIAFFVLLVASAASHLMLVLGVIDRSVSADYAERSYGDVRKSVDVLSRITVELASQVQRETVLEILTRQDLFKKEGDIWYVEDVGFVLKDGRLTEVVLISDPPSPLDDTTPRR